MNTRIVEYCHYARFVARRYALLKSKQGKRSVHCAGIYISNTEPMSCPMQDISFILPLRRKSGRADVSKSYGKRELIWESLGKINLDMPDDAKQWTYNARNSSGNYIRLLILIIFIAHSYTVLIDTTRYSF